MSIPSFLRKSRGKCIQILAWQFDSPAQSDLAHAKLALAFLQLGRQFSAALDELGLKNDSRSVLVAIEAALAGS